MEINNKYQFSLALEPFNVLVYRSEEELNLEISKLIKIGCKFKRKSKINFI